MESIMQHGKGGLTRRQLIGAAAAAGVLGVTAAAGAASAQTGEAGESFTYADTVDWDAAYDVVVVGMGIAGLCAAISAVDAGAKVLVVEKAPEAEAGGNSRVCGQVVAYGSGDVEGTATYFRNLLAGRQLSDDVFAAVTEGFAHTADILADTYGFNRDEFVDYYGKNNAPEYAEFAGDAKITKITAHDGMSDSFIFMGLKDRLAQRADSADVWFASPARELVQDPRSRTVVGVAVERDGQTRLVRARNGVVMACGGFENNPLMVQEYLNLVDYAVIGSFYNEGDGIAMCQKAGARLWHMRSYEGAHGLAGCGYYTPAGQRAAQISKHKVDTLNSGSIVLVGTYGKRFANESYHPRHGHLDEGNGIWENASFPQKMWLVWDQAQMDDIDGSGQFNEDFRDTVLQASSAQELAELTGCKTEVLSKTIADFNGYAAEGDDKEFGRSPEYMRAFEGETLYAMPVKGLILNTQGGPERNGQAQVIDADGNPIPHLYSAGELGGFTACMYQAGSNIAECLVFGTIAGTNAAAPKEDLPAYVAAVRSEAVPAEQGAETDLGASGQTAQAVDDIQAEGLLAGVGQGIGGDVVVAVELDGNGAVASVEVVSHSETEGIGSRAVEQLPGLFAGLSAADEIDAVDAVSGATVTSGAIKDAVKDAMGL